MPVQRTVTNTVAVHSADRDTELRRARGQLSCAECRRLKLKCDKKVPCSSCKRRRCEGICPNGILKGGQDSKLEKLQQKLATMSKRIHQLEIALQAECSNHSNPPITHPLLTEDLLDIKNGIFLFENPEKDGGFNFGEPESQKHEDEEEEEDIVNSLGILSVTEGGEARFVGQSGFQQMVFLAEGKEEDGVQDEATPSIPQSDVAQTNFPQALKNARDMWPFVPPLSASPEALQDLIEAQLPEYGRASSLVEAFLENFSWSFRPLDREQIIEELFPGAYRRGPNSVSGLGADEDVGPLDPHDLALLLMVFSCGACADFSLPAAENREAVLYYELACASLGLKSVLHNASLSAVQAISLVAMFELTRKNNLESSWKIMSLALTVAISIGLHRDPARWKIEPKLIQRRRRLFWEIYLNYSWMCLCSGRPMLFSLDVADCELPMDTESTLSEDGTVVPSFTRWKHRFMKDVLAHIIQRLCTSQPLKYSDILDLDQRIREFNKLQNPYTKSSLPAEWARDTPSETMQRFCTLFFKDIGLMYIHRTLFARALLDYPQNPLRSPFAPSFLAAYRSATTLLKVMRENFDRYPHLFVRTWLVWTHAFASSIIVGSVVSRAPASELAPSAFFELGQAISVFKKAPSHPIAKEGLPILLRVHDKAQRALYEQHSTPSHKSNPSDAAQQEVDDTNDELNLLRGAVRTVVKKKSRKTPTREATATANTFDAPSPASSASSGDTPLSSNQYPTPVDQGGDATAFQAKSNAALFLPRMGAPLGQFLQLPQQQLPFSDLTSPTSPPVYTHATGQAQPLAFPWQLFQTPPAPLFEGISSLDNVNPSLQSGYFDMDINVSDMNFDLSSLLSSEAPNWPTASSSPAGADGFGMMMTSTPPAFLPFPMNLSSQGSAREQMSAAGLRPGADLVEAWRSLYMGAGLSPDAMQSSTGDLNASRNWTDYGFSGAGSS